MQNMKLIRLSATVLGLMLMSQVTMAANFGDVPLGYKHRDAILSLTERGVIRGYTDGSFRPDQTINRAEALKILVETRFLKSEISQALDKHRTQNHHYVNLLDVLMDDWFAPHMEIAYQKGIARGYSDKTFRPNNVINFAEGLKMILATYDITPNQPSEPSDLLYVKADDWFAPYFEYAKDKRLISNHKFYHPGQLLTRGEFAEIVYRLENVQSQQLSRFPDTDAISRSDEYAITIPRLNIVNQAVGHADPYDGKKALEVLRRFALGHYLAAPDEGKKFVLFGHSSGYAWDKSPYKVVLRQIDKLQTGDKIFINYRERGYVYHIEKNEIIPQSQDLKIMENPNRNELVLYTCWPPDSIKQRYVIYAKPIFTQSHLLGSNN